MPARRRRRSSGSGPLDRSGPDRGRRGPCRRPRAGLADRVERPLRLGGSGSMRRTAGLSRRAGDGRDDVLVADIRHQEVPVVAAESQHHDPVGDGLHVGHVVADQHDAVTPLAQAFDEVEHLGGLGDAERRGRLVEDHDPRVADERAGDRDGLPLPAGQGGDRHPHRRDLRRELRAAAPTTAAPSPPRRACRSRARDRGRDWRPRRGCRTGRDPGTPSRCRGSRDSVGVGIDTGVPSKVMTPASAGCTPARILTSVDLPAPLSPTIATTSPA